MAHICVTLGVVMVMVMMKGRTNEGEGWRSERRKLASEDDLTNEKFRHFRNGKHAMLLAL